MTEDQARTFAERMIGTWPSGPRRPVWHEIGLRCSDVEAARRAYADLERSTDHVTTARFHAAYEAAHRRHAAATEPGVPTTCEQCDGTGWIDAPGKVHPDGRTSSAVKPCRCTRGRDAVSTFERMGGTVA